MLVVCVATKLLLTKKSTLPVLWTLILNVAKVSSAKSIPESVDVSVPSFYVLQRIEASPSST